VGALSDDFVTACGVCGDLLGEGCYLKSVADSNESTLALAAVIDLGRKWKVFVRSALPDPMQYKGWFLGDEEVDNRAGTEVSNEASEDHLLAAAIAAVSALALFVVLMVVAAIVFVVDLL
jgi:hypothetical protein